jgi:glutamine amidotransferase
MITIVDYGLGNVQAFVNMYKRLNVEARAASRAEELAGATRLVLPGVGAFDHAMRLLQASGMREPLDDLVLARRVPVIGICVGMQMLADSSDEGQLPGLGWIPGRVRAFKSVPQSAALPLPHMGWNDVEATPSQRLLAGLERDARFYFLHSFFFECADAASVAATAHYGINFACAVHAGHVHGVQFHPEKSHHWGAALLKNFAKL